MNEITKDLKCIVMRNGIEIWREAERLDGLIRLLTGEGKIGFIKVDDEIINAADVLGVFTAQTMEETTRRKNGQWKCYKNVWHEKGEKCFCWQKPLSEMSQAELRRATQ